MSGYAVAQPQNVSAPQEKTVETVSLQRQRSNQAEPAVLHERLFDVAPGTFAEPRFGYDFSLVPAHTDMMRQAQPLLRTGTMVQRYSVNGNAESALAEPTAEATSTTATTEPEEESTQISTSAEPAVEPASEATPTPATTESEVESAAPEETATSALLVEDSAAELAPGQMRKSEFLTQLQAEVTRTAETAMAGTGRTTADCPYLSYWFGYYSLRDVQHGERALRRYAPEASRATTASEYISIVTGRVSQSVGIWVRTGEVTGVPEGISTELPGAGLLERVGSIFRKARNGSARKVDDPRAIQSQLGSGRSLDSGVRSRMESAFGRNFSHVRTHTDTTAAGLSNRLNARAFTIGEHVAFGAGEYKPGTLFGDALIAHEMAHVVQQSGTGDSVAPMQTGDMSYNTLENDADKSAIGAIASLWTGAKDGLSDIAQNAIPRLRSGLRLQRCRDRGATGNCCKYESFTKSNDSYVGSPSGCRKNIKFTFKVKSGSDPRKCVMVNWIKGTAKNKDGTFRKVKMFNKIVDYNFPTMRIDSLDTDPVYWSNSSSRWNYKPAGSDSYYATDSPGPTTWVDGIDYKLNFKMCLHCIDDVSATSGEFGSGVKNPLKCIPWEFKAKYDSSKGKCTR